MKNHSAPSKALFQGGEQKKHKNRHPCLPQGHTINAHSSFMFEDKMFKTRMSFMTVNAKNLDQNLFIYQMEKM